mmetsp:Transcript_101831/g.263159  ORF Transcript_101831/g.263159 Transcript_101831/m.263159 type:complete len:389 (-) Transcript_101831:409-1575(-)
MAVVAMLSPSWGTRHPLTARAVASVASAGIPCAVECVTPPVVSRLRCPRPRSGNWPRTSGHGCRARAGRRVAATPCTVATPCTPQVARAAAQQRTTACVKPASTGHVAAPTAAVRAASCGAAPVALGPGDAAQPPMPSIGPMPVSFCSRAQPAVGQPARKVLCYGDSLTAGFCAEGRKYAPYGRALAEALSAASGGSACEVFVNGHSGHTTEQMVSNLNELAVSDVGGMIGKGLRRCLDEVRPDLVVIMTGTNDLGRDAHPQTVLEDISRLHAECHVRGVPTVAIAPPPAPRAPQGSAFESNRRRLVSLLSNWARSAYQTLTFVDPAEIVPAVAGARVWDPDQLHFSPAGSHLLAQRLSKLLATLPVSAKVGPRALGHHHGSCTHLLL